MKAHTEILSGLIRVGPETDAFGKPFDFTVGFSSVDGKTVVIKGLAAQGDFTAAHAKAIVRAVRRLGLEPVWARRKNGQAVQKRRAPAKRHK